MKDEEKVELIKRLELVIDEVIELRKIVEDSLLEDDDTISDFVDEEDSKSEAEETFDLERILEDYIKRREKGEIAPPPFLPEKTPWSIPGDPWEQPPYNPGIPNPVVGHCSKCGMDLYQVMGYVCYDMECPTFIKPTCFTGNNKTTSNNTEILDNYWDINIDQVED